MEKLISKKLLPRDYSYLHMESHDGEDVFRIKEVTNAVEADMWIMDMSNATKTTWRVSRTYPYSGMTNEYRKDYRCQHSTDKRSYGSRSTKNTNCPALLKIFIKRNQIQNLENDDLLKEYPTEVIFRGEHNHELHSIESLRYRDMSAKTRDKLSSLYRFGYSPASARQMLKMDLIFEHPHDYDEVLIDSQFLPSNSVVCKLFRNEFECKYGPFDDGKMFMNVEDYLSEINKNSGSISELRKTVDGKHYFIVFVSSRMVRCHLVMKQCSELVFLDVVGVTDKHVIYLFTTPSAAGSLPLGVIITDCAEKMVFLEALQCFKILLSDVAFFSVGYPIIFMTDHDISVKNSLKTVFPNSSLVSNQFYLLKSFWSCLSSKNSRIKSHDQDALYSLFKKIVFSSKEDEADLSAAKFICFAKTLDYSYIITYFMSLWEKRKEWVSCFRDELLAPENNITGTSNYYEIVFRFLKDIIFSKTASYNLMQLVHFVVTKYELYMNQRIAEFCIGVSNSSSVLLRLMEENIDLEAFSMEYDVNREVFEVSNVFRFIVDMVRGTCTCEAWSARKRCVHAIIVFLNLESSSTAYNAADIDTKHNMLFISEGVEVDWAKTDPLHSQDENSEPFQTEAGDTNSSKTELDDSSPGTMPSSVKNSIDDDTITDMQLEFNNFIRRIQTGLSSNPNGFLPALKKMLRNAKTLASTDLGLVSAMCSFGVNSTARSAISKATNSSLEDDTVTYNNQSSMKKDGKLIQVTARKILSIERSTSLVETPQELKQHNYADSTSLNERKRKVEHDNLEQCDNETQGETIQNEKKVLKIIAFKTPK